jgi:hypothetical protein
MDVHDIEPGERWQEALQKQIKNIKAVAVLVGNVKLDRWQKMELESSVSEFVNRELPVIPVVLPGARQDPEMPPFLAGFHGVDFRKPNPDPMNQLERGITGKQREKGGGLPE